MNFHFLYAFSSPDTTLVEIKRTDLPEGSPVWMIYHWLLIEGDKVTKLTFKSMERGEVEKREFAEGKLEFTSSKAVYNGSQFVKSDPTDHIKKLISAYLSELDKA